MSAQLLSEIEDAMAEMGIGPHRFGILAADNGRLVERLREGKTVTLVTADRVRTFIAERRAAAPQAAE